MIHVSLWSLWQTKYMDREDSGHLSHVMLETHQLNNFARFACFVAPDGQKTFIA